MALWSIGTLPFLSRLFLGRTSRELEQYMVLMNAVLDGKRVYVDVPFEYPPYVLAWFAGPTMLAEDLGQFRLFFGRSQPCLGSASLRWGTSRHLNGVIRAGNVVVVVGDEGEVLQSTDLGATWTKGTRGSKHLHAVACSRRREHHLVKDPRNERVPVANAFG